MVLEESIIIGVGIIAYVFAFIYKTFPEPKETDTSIENPENSSIRFLFLALSFVTVLLDLFIMYQFSVNAEAMSISQLLNTFFYVIGIVLFLLIALFLFGIALQAINSMRQSKLNKHEPKHYDLKDKS